MIVHLLKASREHFTWEDWVMRYSTLCGLTELPRYWTINPQLVTCFACWAETEGIECSGQ